MSMPAETPWLLTTLPSRTHRTSRTTSAPSSASRSSNAQCVASRFPLPTPEANSSSEPVQTLATQFAVALTPASQRSSTGFSAPRSVPSPPGTMTTSSGGWSAKETSGSTRMPLRHRTGSSRSATSITRSGGAPSFSSSADDAVSTSHGPTKSSSSAPSNTRIPIVLIAPTPLGRRSRGHCMTAGLPGEHGGECGDESGHRRGVAGGAGGVELPDGERAAPWVGYDHVQGRAELVERGADVATAGVLGQRRVGEVEDVDVDVHGEWCVGQRPESGCGGARRVGDQLGLSGDADVERGDLIAFEPGGLGRVGSQEREPSRVQNRAGGEGAGELVADA